MDYPTGWRLSAAAIRAASLKSPCGKRERIGLRHAAVASYDAAVSRLRILFSAAGGHGHLQPLIPLARAAASAGHDILLSAAPSLAAHVQDLALPFAASGPDLTPVRSQLTVQTMDQERQAIPRHFINRLAPARAGDLTQLAANWAADLMVSDEADYGAVVAAETLDLPHATVITSGTGGMTTRPLIQAPLETLRAMFQLAPEDGTIMLERSLKLNPFPPSFRNPTDRLIGHVLTYRPGPIPPPPTKQNPVQVYVTLGTIFNTESGDLLARITTATAASPHVGQVIVATGEHVDPTELGPQQPKVTSTRFLDQKATLAGCSAVICHGGSGTVLDAISYGLPLVMLPLGADQPLNAARCHQLGCGIVLNPTLVTPQQITAAVDEILTSPTHRTATAELQTELRRLPGPDSVIRALEDHTAGFVSRRAHLTTGDRPYPT